MAFQKMGSIFLRGLPMVLIKKSKKFSCLFLIKVSVEIMSGYGLERKEASQGDKNIRFLKSKNWVFSKGVNPWFQSKNPKFLLICV